MNTQEDIQITTNDSVEDCADAVLQPKGLKVTKKLINVGTRKRVTQSTASLYGQRDQPKNYYHES